MRPLLIFAAAAVTAHPVFSQEKPTSKITVPNGFVAEVVAAPPLVEHPIMAAFDDRGRLFVSENKGLNLKKEELEVQKPNSIRLLTDTDNDGVFDEFSIFANNLTFPQGALWLMDSLYVMSPPSLWRFEDTDDDGVADVREELVTGFDYTGNAADVHGPFLHPNGRLYWCHGRKGHDVTDDSSGELVSQAKGARIWSCQPDGSDVRVFAGGGMDNPVEVDFTPSGEIVGSVNLFYGRPRGDVLVHWIRGGAYPRYDQETVIAEFPRTGPLLTEFHNFGHVAISGMMRYRSGALNQFWKHNLFATHFNTQEITRTEFGPFGSTYAAGKTESIFKINDPDAHLTDVLEDANGDLIILDTGGWFRIGCPTSQVAKPEIAGAIYRLRKAGEPDRETDFRGVSVKWDSIDPEEVADYLDSEHFAVRERAVTELAIRGQTAIPEATEILTDLTTTPLTRQNAIWALSRINFSEATDLIAGALADPDMGVRQAAANALAATRTWQAAANNEPNEAEIEFARNDVIGVELAKLALTSDLHVARASASALGSMADPNAVAALLEVAGKESTDRFLQHAAIYSLIEIGDAAGTREGLASENEKQIIAALWALDQMEGGDLEPLDVIGFLQSDNEALREVAIEIAGRHEEWEAAIANRFLDWEEPTAAQKDAMSALIPKFLYLPPMQDVVTLLIQSDSLTRQEIGYTAVADAEKPFPFPAEWQPSFEKALQNSPPELVNTVLNALATVKPDPVPDSFAGVINGIANSETNPVPLRVRALRAMGNSDAPLSPEAFELLTSLISAEASPLQRLDAIQMLAASKLTKAQQLAIAERIEFTGPLDLPILWRVLDRTRDEATGKVLAENLPKSPGFGNLDPAELRRTFSRFPKEIGESIESHITELEELAASRHSRLSELEARVAKGNAKRGEAHFAAGKGACITCHQIGETGRAVGPNLSTIGRIRTHRDLLESVLYPGESLARDFETYQVTLKDGSGLVGLIQRETTDTVYVTDVTGVEKPYARAEVKSIQPVAMSIMPQGLDQSMTEGELLDLVAYLKSLR